MNPHRSQLEISRPSRRHQSREMDVTLDPVPRVSFAIGPDRFTYAEEIDWAERGTQIVRGDLVGEDIDPTSLIPSDLPAELRGKLEPTWSVRFSRLPRNCAIAQSRVARFQNHRSSPIWPFRHRNVETGSSGEAYRCVAWLTRHACAISISSGRDCSTSAGRKSKNGNGRSKSFRSSGVASIRQLPICRRYRVSPRGPEATGHIPEDASCLPRSAFSRDSD